MIAITIAITGISIVLSLVANRIIDLLEEQNALLKERNEAIKRFHKSIGLKE